MYIKGMYMKHGSNFRANDFHKAVNEKILITQKIVLRELLQTIIGAQTLSPEAFVEEYANEKSTSLPAMSEMNRKFFEKILDVIYREVNRIPSITCSFEMLADCVDDADVGKKLVKKTALPHVLALIADIDKCKKSFIRNR